jgi:hypothetical protein
MTNMKSVRLVVVRAVAAAACLTLYRYHSQHAVRYTARDGHQHRPSDSAGGLRKTDPRCTYNGNNSRLRFSLSAGQPVDQRRPNFIGTTDQGRQKRGAGRNSARTDEVPEAVRR